MMETGKTVTLAAATRAAYNAAIEEVNTLGEAIELVSLLLDKMEALGLDLKLAEYLCEDIWSARNSK